MKQITSLFFCTLFLLLTSSLTAQNLTFLPEDCSPGDKITITYNPAGTALEDVNSFDAVAYQFTDDGLLASDVQLTLVDNIYSGTIETSKDANALFLSLTSDDRKKKDNNGDKGYGLKMKVADKSSKVPGAYSSMASAYGLYYRNLGIEKDFDRALKYIKKEFKANPNLKNEKKYLEAYARYGSAAKDEEAITDVKGIIESLQEQKTKTEEDWILTHNLLRTQGEKDASAELEKTILEKYPDGKMAKDNLVSSFYKAKDLQNKLDLYQEIKTKYGEDEKVKKSLINYAGSIAMEYAKLEDWTNFDKYFSLVTDPVRKASLLNSLAWGMSGEAIAAEAPKAEKGAKLSLQSLNLLSAEMENGDSKPASMSVKQWNKQLTFSHGMYADTYALLQYHNGNFEDAFKYQKIAGKANDFRDGEMNERFCIYAEKAKGPEKAEKKLQWFIKEGNATSKMKEQYQRVFMANNNLESAYAKHLASLESVAADKKRGELKEKMINQEAPDFQLVNLKGEKVSLHDMKGKVVVLDFWATWCGPCKASFPGMQKAVNKYADNDQVEFLFLDTWESGENKEEKAAKFIEEKGYTFNVVMDNDNTVVSNYNVSGIPTKFVVDKNGKIRFKSSGFSGSDDGLVSELSMMIEMAEEASTPKTASMP